MGLLRPIAKTAPVHYPGLPWPVDGTAYVAMWMGPICGGGLGGVLSGTTIVGNLAGVLMGGFTGLIGAAFIFALHGWLFDKFIEPPLGKFQRHLQPLFVRFLLTIIGYAWAMVLAFLTLFLSAWLTLFVLRPFAA